MMLTRCPDETMVAWQACGGEAGVWRRGIGMAQASGLKGRWSGHGEDERHLGWCRSTWLCKDIVTKRPPPRNFLKRGSSFRQKNRCKKSQRRISFPSRGAGPPASGPRPRRHSQPAGRHASAVSSEGDLRLCLASPAACASEFKPLARPESARAREPREKGPGLRVPVCARA